ncbi:hypothetical protein DEO72_LG3g1114 [Vigna unguiculata]|uniref:Uncharacterized protein n=1 Tax=Vigna unguiculata TaxID=3917 RepID=A0A4D6LDL6_VIGUN|nr:hypothetical protein DEO72_LG3g1114 [Vigna unguiculata]
MSSTSDSVSLSSSSSGSVRSRENVGRRLEEGSVSPTTVLGRIPMETITEVREDPPEEIAKSSWLLNSWLNCTPVIARDVDRDIVSLKRVSTVEHVVVIRLCYGGASPIKRGTYSTASEQMGVLVGLLCPLSIAVSTSVSSCIFILLRHKAPTTDNMAILGEQAEYKREGGHICSTQMGVPNSLLVGRVTLGGHMAQVGKKNLTLFQALRKKKAVKAKEAGNTEVPNLQESLVEVHVHGDSKRKAELPARPSRGKDVKKVRVALLGQGSSSGAKGSKAGSIKQLEMTVRKDIEINMTETLINSINKS